jgi:hypothetical protein
VVQGIARRCAVWLKNWATSNAKDTYKCGESTNLGALRSKIRYETNNRIRLLEYVQRKRP